AVRRFAEGLRRAMADDQALDLAIAAEALFLAGEDDHAELSRQFRTRAAIWLSADPTDRRQISVDFRELYKARSAIAHGGQVKPDKLDAVTAKARTHMRSALCAALDWCAKGKSDGETRLLNWEESLLTTAKLP